MAQSSTAGANVGIIRGDGATVLVDSHIFPTVAESLARALAREGQPVQAVVNTHWHIDHVHGNAAVARVVGPSLDIVAHQTANRDIPDRAPIQLGFWPDFFGRDISGLQDHLAGSDLSEGDRRSALEMEITAKERLATELTHADIAGPTRTFDDRYTLTASGRTIELYHFGRGHTEGDVVVFDPATGVAFTGDFLVGASRYPVEHAAAIERFLALPVRIIVPGHGDVEHGTASAERLLRHLRGIITAVEEGIAAGSGPDDIAAGIPDTEGLFDPAGIARRSYDALTRFETGTFVSHGVELTYALDLPAGDGPFPGMVLGHGSGHRVRTEQVQTAAQWVSRGFAVLRYDKRGVGDSHGHYAGIGVSNSDTMLALLADDMVAAARLLADHPLVDPARLGFHGASQAGWIIPQALVKAPDIQFGVVLVGPAVSVGLENAYSDLAERSETSLEEVYRRFDPANDPGGFDPVPVLRDVRQPLLWIMGGDDRSLPTRTSVANLEPLIAAGAPIALEVFPTGTHGLRDSRTGAFLPVWDTVDRWLEAEGLGR
jgi:glyoxylase-like metal-dependent hydrolase (beta-lactamase superfamily II)/dienelactone hydrolase